jgi:hypothetical protein
MRTRHAKPLAIGLAIVALGIVGAVTTAAACVVGTGSSASCTDAALNACLPGGAKFDGLVTFNCGGPATIDISTGTGTKTISANTTIDGGGLVTISGGNAVQVFVVSGVTFTVRNLTIANGSALQGGGILNSNNGTVNITNSTFDHNSAATGGGVENSGGTVDITNSTFDHNSATAGGGVENSSGTMRVTNTTFDHNSATGGGGIHNYSGTLTVTNSTFDHNSATVAGGIIQTQTDAEVTLTNVIIANSTNGDCIIIAGAVNDGGHNLIEDTGTNACGLINGTNGNIIGQDPHLDPAGLQNNGGPTQTVAVLAGSPAINAGDDAVCTADPVNGLDQRGYARPGVGFPNCTIGAYEYRAIPPVPAPAASVAGVAALVALLTAVGGFGMRRRARR